MSLLHDNAPFLFAVLFVSIAGLAIALLAERLARRASAAARHTILVAALLLPVVLAAAGALGLNLPLPAAPPPGAVEVAMTPAGPPPPPRPQSQWPGIFAAIWLAGAAIALLRVAAVTSRWRDVARRAVPIFDDELLRLFGARYELAQSADCAEPTVIGIVKPTIVLPAGYDLSRDELRAVFAHELAHVARRDNLIALIVHAICALFWFDPLHRIARRRLVDLRERACDDAVLDAGCDPRAYIAALARSCQSSVHVPAVACMSRLNLQERMESIMTHETRRRIPTWIVRIAVSTTIAVAAVAFATFAPAPALSASEPVTAATGYDFDVRVIPYEKKFTVTVRVDTPEGPFTFVTVMTYVPGTFTNSTTRGDKTYLVTVNLAVDGSAEATLEVRQGAEVLTTARKQFSAPAPPEPRVPSNARRLGEPGLVPPKAISRVEPVFTGEAKAAGVSGVCIVEATISETGDVTAVRVVKPMPYGLDKATVDAVKQWKFEPATLDGKPVPVLFNVTMNFKTGE